MKRQQVVIVLLAMALGLGLRLWKFGQIPDGLHLDETSFGYNAWSLLTTGRDEFGTKLPVAIRAYDDWRPPVYTYLTAGLMRLCGVDDWVVRLPSLVSGLACLGIVYWWFTKMWGRKVGGWAVMALSLNPALIFLSRTAFDANLALTVSIATFGLLWYGLNRTRFKWWGVGLVLSALATVSYQANKVFVPVMLLAMLVIHRTDLKKLMRQKQNRIATGFLCLGWFFLVLIISGGSPGMARFKGMSIMGDAGVLTRAVSRQQALKSSGLNPEWLNRRIYFGEEMWRRYLDYWSPSYWFAGTNQPTLFKFPGLGLFYGFELLLMIAGIRSGVKKLRKKDKYWWLVWTIFAPVPAAVLVAEPLVTRALPMIITGIMLVALGIESLTPNLQRVVWGGYIIGAMWLGLSLVVLVDAEQGELWHGDYREWVAWVAGHEQDFDQVVVSNSLTAPYIYYLWYGKVEPVDYLASGGTKNGNILDPENRVEKIEFRQLHNSVDWYREKTLVIARAMEVPRGVEVVHEFACRETDKTRCVVAVVSP